MVAERVPEPALDLSRRRVWVGLAVPGKKMAALLAAREYMPQRDLVRLYQGAAHKTAIMTALALHASRELPQDERDATLLDTLEFLEFRFRAIIPPAGSFWPPSAVAEALRSGSLPSGVSAADPEAALMFTMDAIDVLSNGTARDLDAKAALDHVVTLLRATAHQLAPDFEDSDEPDEYLASAEAHFDPKPAKRKKRRKRR
jgi:hypothetical protein